MKLNQFYAIGFLTKDAEIKAYKSGVKRQDFTLAINDDYKKSGTDEWIKRPYYINCFSVGKTYDGLFKGVKVIIDGKIVQRNYETKEGQKKTYYGVEVYTLDLMKEPIKKETKIHEEQPQSPYVTESVEEPEEELPF